MSLEEKTSIDNLRSISSEINPSKISLAISQSTVGNNFQSTKSTTHFIQPIGTVRQTDGLMTKATLAAINKVYNIKLNF